MCKIFAITDMTNVEITSKLIQVVKNNVAKVPDNQGFGYAVLGSNGHMGGERSIRVKTFKALTAINTSQSKIEELPFVEKTSNRFGNLTMAMQAPKSFIAHGRLSTNTVNLFNSHPFSNGEIAMIHNGVVYDAVGSVKHLLKTNNDSEIIFRYWEKNGMNAVEENVSGYYALAILDKRDGTLHIARDDKATLYIAWVRTINSYMIATTAEIIHNVCKEMKWKYDGAEAIVNNHYAVFDRNEIKSNRDINPLEFKNYEADDNFNEKAAKALGVKEYKYTDDDDDGDIPSYRENYRAYDDYDDYDYEDDVPPLSYKELMDKDDDEEIERLKRGA